MDIAVCAEYEDGERFWCHFSSNMLNELMEMAKLCGIAETEGDEKQ